ncbi:recombinase family protein [Microbispora sp. GKU 823]|uniref:recombinase family protein n=1 Tax=Microbispora sp. GKU 823 TaxID=1652100 RepID=UPI0009C6568A|nr:recombinase family protein [Microbispora sp. GKU 823]OPG02110.1 hypothetical protein B1L11_43185 [Microbispora sp. GKU 823]
MPTPASPFDTLTPRRRGKIYIRVSSTKGRDEIYSPEMQEQAARARAAQEGIEVVGVVYDLNKSGRDFAKRKIQEMIDEVRRGEYEVVLLWKWSRFGRNLRDSLNNLHELEKAGGVALSGTEPGDSHTTMGRFTRGQMLLIAELQSDQIGDSWRDTHRILLDMGLPHNGVARFGYKRVGKTYEPEPIIADALAEMYQRYVDDEPLSSAARDMANLGIRASNGEVLTSARWLTAMETGFAAGLIRKRKPGATSRRFDQWDWYPGAHPAIISRELWDAFCAKRTSSLGRNWASTKAKYSISGILRCWRCDRKMTAGADARTPPQVRFRCPGIVTRECKGVTVLLKVAEAEILEWTENRAQSLETVEDMARKAATERTRSSEIDKLQRAVADAERQLERLVELYEDDAIDRETYNRRRAMRESERSQAQIRLSELGAAETAAKRAMPPEFFKGMREAWPVISQDRRRQLIKQVVQKIVVHPGHRGDKRLEIVPF